MMPSQEKFMTCQQFYDMLLALNTSIFKQCRTGAVAALYNDLCQTFQQMSIGKPPKKLRYLGRIDVHENSGPAVAVFFQVSSI